MSRRNSAPSTVAYARSRSTTIGSAPPAIPSPSCRVTSETSWASRSGNALVVLDDLLDRRPVDGQHDLNVATRGIGIRASLVCRRHQVCGRQGGDMRRMQIEGNAEAEAAVSGRAEADPGRNA